VVVTNRSAAPTLPAPASILHSLVAWRRGSPSSSSLEQQQRLAVQLFRHTRDHFASPGRLRGIAPELCNKLFQVALQSGLPALVADVITFVMLPAVKSLPQCNPFDKDALTLPLLAASWRS
jgi:hypothetical protein